MMITIINKIMITILIIQYDKYRDDGDENCNFSKVQNSAF